MKHEAFLKNCIVLDFLDLTRVCRLKSSNTILRRPPDEHILLLEETFILTPYRTSDGCEHDPITEAVLMAEANGTDDPENIAYAVFSNVLKRKTRMDEFIRLI